MAGEPNRMRRGWWYPVAGVVLLVGAMALSLPHNERAAAVLGSAGKSPATVAPAARGLTGPRPPVPAAEAATPAPPVSPRCAEARAWVEAAGLPLPAGTVYRCPSTQFPHHGTACWYAEACRRGRFVAINTEMMGNVTPAYLHYVVAHEVCHIIQFDATGESSEAQADVCATAHGAPAVSGRPDS